MISQSLATGWSLTNHHRQKQKRDEVKNQVFCRAPWFYFHKREVQGEARSPCRGTGSTWRACLCASASASADITGSRGLLICISQVTLLVRPRLPQHIFTGVSECTKKPAETLAVLGSQSCSLPRWPCFTRWPYKTLWLRSVWIPYTLHTTIISPPALTPNFREQPCPRLLAVGGRAGPGCKGRDGMERQRGHRHTSEDFAPWIHDTGWSVLI